MAIATKYQAGIVLVTLVAAAFVSPVVHARVRNLALALGLLCAGFLAANPYALLDHQAFRDALEKQTETAGEEGGKLGLANSSGWRYYLQTFTWGFGWLPSLFALGGAVALAARQRRLAILLAPAPLLLFLYLGEQARFFARWMLPIYPLLCLLAAFGAVALVDRLRVRPALALGGLSVLAARAGTRVQRPQRPRAGARRHALGGARVDEGQHPGGREHRHGADRARPVGDGPRAAAVLGRGGTRSGNRWNKWRTSRSCFFNGRQQRSGSCPVIKLEDYERTLRPELIDSYEKGGFCWVVTGSTQFGRAYADPQEVPYALRYYDELRRRGEVVFRIGNDHPFSFDYSFNYYPLTYERPGPEIVIYRLQGNTARHEARSRGRGRPRVARARPCRT